MRKLIYAVALTAAVTGCGGGKNRGQQTGQEMLIGVVDTIRPADNEQADTVSAQEPEGLPGDTLCEYDGKTVMYRLTQDDDEPQSMEFYEITTYKDSKPTGTCHVKGYCNIGVGNGKDLKVAVGVDTLTYRIASLPKSINPVKDLAGRNTKAHMARHTFKAGKNPWENSFSMYAYLPKESPKYINNVIAAILHRDIEMILGDENQAPELMDLYQKLQENPESFKGLNTDKASANEIGKYFARRFEKRYRKTYSNEIKESGGPTEEYVLETGPVWNSEDITMTTYRFYTYHYGGGAHGMMQEFYLTFNNEDGRVLGYEDILGEDGMRNAIHKVKRKLGKILDYVDENSGAVTADLGKEGTRNDYDRLLNETFNGYVYPRLAVTRQGNVFTYQPYEKGSFADGILHVAVGR